MMAFGALGGNCRGHGSDEQIFGAIQQVPHSGSSDQHVTVSGTEFLRPPLELRGESTMELLIAFPSIFLFLLAEVVRHRREEEEKAHRLVSP
jgi:hypothetical protein